MDPWCVGWFSSDDNPNRRLAEPIFYLQRGDPAVDSIYTQPLEGLVLRMDLWAQPPAVVFFDQSEAPPPPEPVPALRFPDYEGEAQRPALSPLSVTQPEGAGFSLGLDGGLQWQRWRGVVSFTAREGAVLSQLTYDGRPVAWRLSFAEMVVPYGDPHPPHYKKSAFDAGEDGLGRNAHSLDPSRCDCAPGAAASFLDGALVAEDGGVEVIKRAVCVHEEDGGILWKHLDWRTGEAVARRGRHLVIMFLCTIANYTYGFTYRLGIDAGIHMEATLTGILSIGLLPAAAAQPTAAEPASAAAAPARHQASTYPWGQALPNRL